VTWRGQKIPRGVKLWLVGTDIVKALLYARMRQSQPGPGFLHLPAALANTDEFEQLTAERLVTKYIKGHARMEWVKPNGRRNEALDCAVYAYAAACHLGIQTYRENGWTMREQKFQPSLDLFNQPAQTGTQAQPQAAQASAQQQPPPKPKPLPTRPQQRQAAGRVW
jgi:phage terminase large subunit GpA-like protein